MRLTSKIFVSIGMCFMMLSVFLASSNAATITLSDLSSEQSTSPAADLSATLTFEVTGNELTVTVNNLSAYSIEQIYFNSSSQVTGLSDQSLGSWNYYTGNVGQNTADGFGVFDHAIKTSGKPNAIAAGSSMEFTFDITGTGYSDTSFMDLNSEGALAAAHFISGPDGQSAFGAAVPIPGAAVLLGSGLGLLVVLRRKRK